MKKKILKEKCQKYFFVEINHIKTTNISSLLIFESQIYLYGLFTVIGTAFIFSFLSSLLVISAVEIWKLTVAVSQTKFKPGPGLVYMVWPT